MKDTNLIGFDNEKYIREQTNSILERVNRLSHVNPRIMCTLQNPLFTELPKDKPLIRLSGSCMCQLKAREGNKHKF